MIWVWLLSIYEAQGSNSDPVLLGFGHKARTIPIDNVDIQSDLNLVIILSILIP